MLSDFVQSCSVSEYEKFFDDGLPFTNDTTIYRHYQLNWHNGMLMMLTSPPSSGTILE